MKNVFYISIGSNIEKEKNMKKCFALLRKGFGTIVFSRVFETKPVGFKEQENFFNAVCRVETKNSFEDTKRYLKEIEKQFGRKKTAIKSGPRTMDLDILIRNKKTVNKDAVQEYNLIGLKDVLLEGESEKKISELVLRQKPKKSVDVV